MASDCSQVWLYLLTHGQRRQFAGDGIRYFGGDGLKRGFALSVFCLGHLARCLLIISFAADAFAFVFSWTSNIGAVTAVSVANMTDDFLDGPGPLGYTVMLMATLTPFVKLTLLWHNFKGLVEIGLMSSVRPDCL